MKIVNQTRESVIAVQAVLASTFLSRMIGLLNRKNIAPGEALIITHCRSIHMFFMRFAIDVIFLDKEYRVVALVPRIKPFQLSKIYWNAFSCIELPAGSIAGTHTQIGDQIAIK